MQGAPTQAVLAASARGLALLAPCLTEESGVVERIAASLAYQHALALCHADELDRALQELEAYEAGAGEAPLRWRYAADLWNEWILATRRAESGASRDEGPSRARLFGALRRAVELGYREVEELRTTPALDPFRDDPEPLEILRLADSQL